MDDDRAVVLVDGAGYGARGTEDQGNLFDKFVMERET